eukprot:1553383-Prymnesium_polylepis.2
MLRQNVFAPLAGSGSRLFLHLKSADSTKGDAFGASFSSHKSDAHKLAASLAAVPWLNASVAEAVVIGGSGAVGQQTVGLPAFVVVRGDVRLWRQFRATPCRHAANTSTSGGSAART